MTVANGITSIADAQHMVLDDVSWEFYEHLLREIGSRQIRVTFDQGNLEIMSPLPKHERWGAWIGRLIELMCFERSIDCQPLGSTTFRDEAQQKGLEPDACYYFKQAAVARQLEAAWNPDTDPVPELVVEIDITSRSIPREPIFAALGIKELWRFDGSKLQVLHLSPKGKYVTRAKSIAFPFLPLDKFSQFVLRGRDKDQLKVLREFRAWAISL